MTAAILDIRPAVPRDQIPPGAATTALIRCFGLDRLPEGRPLVCRWQRDRDGRLSCFWEPDIALAAER
jgi:hypothetical protein